MGLFNFGAAVDPAELEKKLKESCTAEQLTEAGLSSFSVGTSDEHSVICSSMEKLNSHYCLKLKGFKHKEKSEWYGADELFTLAEKVGSGDAAFFLGIIYEHGLCGCKQDQTEANRHYDIATVRDCKLAAALKYIKIHMKTRHDMATDQYESLAINMHTMCYANLEEAVTVRSMLIKEDIRKLLQISTYLLYFYAQKEYPQCLAMLGLMLTSRAEMLNKGMLHDYICTNSYAATVGQIMGRKVWNMAKAGDSRAIVACQTYGIIGT